METREQKIEELKKEIEILNTKIAVCISGSNNLPFRSFVNKKLELKKELEELYGNKTRKD